MSSTNCVLIINSFHKYQVDRDNCPLLLRLFCPYDKNTLKLARFKLDYCICRQSWVPRPDRRHVAAHSMC